MISQQQEDYNTYLGEIGYGQALLNWEQGWYVHRLSTSHVNRLEAKLDWLIRLLTKGAESMPIQMSPTEMRADKVREEQYLEKIWADIEELESLEPNPERAAYMYHLIHIYKHYHGKLYPETITGTLSVKHDSQSMHNPMPSKDVLPARTLPQESEYSQNPRPHRSFFTDPK